MESVFYLGYGPLPSIFLRMPSSTITAPASTKLRCGFNHSFISVSSGFSHRRRCHHFYRIRPLALDRSNLMTSGNEKEGGGGKIVRGAVGASLALACALSIIGCSCKMNSKAIACPPTARKMALTSLLDVTVNLASEERRNYWDSFSPPKLLPPSKEIAPRDSLSPHKINKLKKDAVNLMKRGKPDEARSMLEKEHDKYKKSEPESAYNLAMALTEILIYQGKYEEALKLLSGVNDQKFSGFELRPTLYKAILLTMLDRDEDAQELWDKFAESNGWMSPKTHDSS